MHRLMHHPPQQQMRQQHVQGDSARSKLSHDGRVQGVDRQPEQSWCLDLLTHDGVTSNRGPSGQRRRRRRWLRGSGGLRRRLILVLLRRHVRVHHIASALWLDRWCQQRLTNIEQPGPQPPWLTCCAAHTAAQWQAHSACAGDQQPMQGAHCCRSAPSPQHVPLLPCALPWH
jgi:hypothetical protein